VRFIFAVLAVLATSSSANVPPPPGPIASRLVASVPVGFPGLVAIIAPHPNGATDYGVTGSPPFNTLSKWRWASVTKQIVAVMVMQEVEEGHVDLDRPATTYLPHVALPGGDAVTVRRLLSHTSGLYDPNSGPAGPDGTPLAYLRSKTPAPMGLDPQCLKPSGRAPGEGFVYNNCDYVVLGAMLEAVTHKPFAVLVRERIAMPLGLKSLRVLKPGDHDDIVAVDEKGATDAQVDPGRYGSAANLAGTADDLLKFDRALIDGKLLGPAATDEPWQGKGLTWELLSAALCPSA